MSTRNKVWLVAAIVFTAVNLVGLGMAGAAGEGMHSAVHAVLAVLGAVATWRLSVGRRPTVAPDAELAEARLEQLQQSVDAIALEVERIGESQRFNAKLQSQQGDAPR